jgi:hypothetical protein
MILGAVQLSAIKELREKAEKRPYTFDDLLDIKNGAIKPPGDDGFKISIPVGFEVCFTHEYNSNNGKIQKGRHLSVSVDIPGKLPSVESVNLLLPEFGFDGETVLDCIVNLEDISDTHQAVSVFEFIK